MAYKVFANGNPLPASDLNTYLMNQAVISFANSTARSTAIPTPVEGMLTYLEDTNAYEGWTGSAWVNINDNSGSIPLSTVTTAGDLIVANGNASVTRLGIGTNGQVLSSNGTTATWTSPATGGATLLSTTSLSGSTVTVSSINQTYNDLKIEIIGATTTAASYLIFYLRNSGSNMPHRTFMVDLANGQIYRLLANYVEFNRGYNSATLEASALIPSYSASQAHAINFISHMPDGDVPNFAFGYTESNSPINEVRLETGSSFTGGTMKIWGIK